MRIETDNDFITDDGLRDTGDGGTLIITKDVGV